MPQTCMQLGCSQETLLPMLCLIYLLPLLLCVDIAAALDVPTSSSLRRVSFRLLPPPPNQGAPANGLAALRLLLWTHVVSSLCADRALSAGGR